MRVRHLALCALLLLLASPGYATEVGTSRAFGVGVQVGEPTAIVGKAFLGRSNAIDLGIGFAGFGWRGRCRDAEHHWHDCHNRHDYFSVHADWLWEETIREQPFRLSNLAGTRSGSRGSGLSAGSSDSRTQGHA